ncbi:hypothetical protein [Leeia aquatica]|uniref:Uncharacterized protein n=1 Tax=Leeia aquatica TaxID=2725557 RepID=A0A847S3B6_9NEIS|nr:hypothetical protein [Leeia aquatica]NLR74254.1 hypothetical protein [Leeia aquatica]
MKKPLLPAGYGLLIAPGVPILMLYFALGAYGHTGAFFFLAFLAYLVALLLGVPVHHYLRYKHHSSLLAYILSGALVGLFGVHLILSIPSNSALPMLSLLVFFTPIVLALAFWKRWLKGRIRHAGLALLACSMLYAAYLTAVYFLLKDEGVVEFGIVPGIAAAIMATSGLIFWLLSVCGIRKNLPQTTSSLATSRH